MPVYEYECIKCGHQTEMLQRMTDPPLSKCEICSGKMKKLISNSTFHLKGSGWYVTDYASKSGGHDGKTGSSNESSSIKEASSTSNEAKSTGEKSQKNSSSDGEIKAKAKD